MLFTTPVFLFLFLPIFATAYFITPARFKNFVLIVFSLVFYFWAEPKFIFVVLFSLVVDWLLGNAIHRTRDAHRRKQLMTVFVVLNVALLIYFKYMNFFVENANALLGLAKLNQIRWTAVALPLALSFIVFEKITYGVDIYRGVGRPARTLSLYVLYSLLFPKLIAGPIVKYHEIEAQLEERQVLIDDILTGAFRFSLGLARKVWVADTLSVLADRAFQTPAAMLSPRQAWIGLLCYTFQIYFDFAGYSDMAIGLARMAGFRLRENFNFPYISASFTEFWRRWHISLSTWIKEYLYFPLGGNRVSPPRAYFNLGFCFFISGLWHGARWSFVIWGIYHGLFLVLDKLRWLRVVEKSARALTVPLTFLLVMIGWVFFRSVDLTQALSYIATLFRVRSWVDPREATIFYADNTVIFLLGIAMVGAFLPLIIRRNLQRESTLDFGTMNHVSMIGIASTFALLLAGVLKVAMAHFEPFIYFRF